MPKPELVYDAWWPWCLGVVLWRKKTRLRVRFSDGREATYDKAHQRFLHPYTPTLSRKAGA